LWITTLALVGPAFADETERAPNPTALRDRSALIVVLCEDGGRSAGGRFVEQLGRRAIAPFVRPYYRERVWLHGPAATGEAFLAGVRQLATSHDVVDALLFVHGSDDRTYFADGPLSSKQLVAGLAGRGGARLRMVYTTACYSTSTIHAWRTAGAHAVRGMCGVNRPLDFPRFMLGWLGGEDYATANRAGLASNASLHRAANALRPLLLDQIERLREEQALAAELRDLLRIATRSWFAEPWDLTESTPEILGGNARIDRLPPAHAE
jgi:hypothetical protein